MVFPVTMPQRIAANGKRNYYHQVFKAGIVYNICSQNR